MRAALALLLLTLLAHGSQWFRPGWSGTEAFRSLISHGMVESGDYLVPRLGGELMLTKPPLVYWMLAAAEQSFGLGRIALRVPALLCTWLAALAVFRVFARRFDPATGWLAAIGLLLAPVQLWHVAFAEIDPPFSALTVVSMVWLAEAIATGAGPRSFVAAGLVGSLAMLSKGPPYLMFLVGALLLWPRATWGRGLLPFLLALGLPFATYYLVLVQAPGALEPDELSRLAAEESVGRIAGYDLASLVDAPLHLLRAAALTLPFGLFALWRTPGLSAEQERLRRVCLFGFAACVVALLLFPKRPVRYLMPGLCLAIVAAAPAVAAWLRAEGAPGRAARRAVAALGGLGLLAALVLPWLPYPMPGRSWFGALAIGIAGWRVRSRAGVLAFAVLAPMVLVWTVGADRDERQNAGIRSDGQLTAILRRELGAAGSVSFEVWGYMRESLVMELDPSARWILGRDREPAADSILFKQQDHRPPTALPAGFVERARVRGRSEDFVLAVRER
jgi:4-amino-4-deoxy-L-arabinose transferase